MLALSAVSRTARLAADGNETPCQGQLSGTKASASFDGAPTTATRQGAACSEAIAVKYERRGGKNRHPAPEAAKPGIFSHLLSDLLRERSFEARDAVPSFLMSAAESTLVSAPRAANLPARDQPVCCPLTRCASGQQTARVVRTGEQSVIS